MNNEAVSQQPPSPPHSDDGNLVGAVGKPDSGRDLFTPPRAIRPDSRNALPYGSYGTTSLYPPVPQPMYYSPQPPLLQQIPYHTPPSFAEPGIMTRSGKSLGSPIDSRRHRDRDSRSPKPRKNRNTKSGKRSLPVIDQPLSVLTKDYKVPVRDMGAWVNRPAEDRLKEVEKKKGYVSRPMNSFMLYRSAYAERVKQFCKENNHQVVSQVTGQSWPMEPRHIREMYEQYAIIERDNHAAAHPTYKFAPNKGGKKRGRDDDDDDASDSDDEWRGAGSTKRSRPGTRGESRSLSSTPFDTDRAARYHPSMYHQAPQPHPSAYHVINPYAMPPYGYGSGDMNGIYYQSPPMPYGHPVDEVNQFAPMEEPFPPYDMDSQLIGMPNGHSNELLGLPDSVNGGMNAEQMLDPHLVQLDRNYTYDHYAGTVDQSVQVPRNYGYDQYPGVAEVSHIGEQIHPGMTTLTQGWPEQVGPGSDFDNEFGRWK